MVSRATTDLIRRSARDTMSFSFPHDDKKARKNEVAVLRSWRASACLGLVLIVS